MSVRNMQRIVISGHVDLLNLYTHKFHIFHHGGFLNLKTVRVNPELASEVEVFWP